MARLAMLPPTKIVAVGLNYRSHAAELGMDVPGTPVLFLKPPSAVIGPGDEITLPPDSSRVEHEAELAIVISQRSRNLTLEEAPQAVLGYTCANDVTARDLQQADGQWTRSKSFDTFCPLGPWVETAEPQPDAKVELEVNGEPRQSAPLSDMVFSPISLVVFISRIMTLERGDVIMTGTPPGVGPLLDGDEVVVKIDGIGELSNRVSGVRPG
jgi:2-keto-4-pentenoate hydratase/2-oxohepta-3-ene-1,7-dioic acid hydratase in catechol pathway